ncbi:MAG: GmrSD restriction endonuclease domain-containing protein [Myxococcota bacterium]
MTVSSAMGRIEERHFLLPAIQREYVWSEERIYSFLDSLMRGYPFGQLLFWNTKDRVQYREFVKDYIDGVRFTLQVKPEGERGTMVLDGQQRLQSLYLALRGTHEHRVLHLNLLSGDAADASEQHYEFDFLGSAEAERRNATNAGAEYWVPLRAIEQIADYAHKHARIQQWIASAGLTDPQAVGRLGQTVEIAHARLRGEERLSFFTVDREYGDNGVQTSVDEILEIFVRINSGGQVLGKSDLMFSLMQLHWEDAYDDLEDLCDEVNRKGRFSFDKDFAIKCALVCLGKGARYDVAKLRNEQTLSALQESFPAIRNALTHTVDLVVNVARIQDQRILGSYNALIPFVYYMYLQGGRPLKSEQERLAVAHLLYLALMTHAFSRYADSRIDGAVRDVFNPAHESKPGAFPTDALREFIRSKEGADRIDDDLLQRNMHLVMNLIEGGSLLPEGRRRHRPEYDHIFPQSALRERGVPEDEINHFANFRLISKQENIWKLDKDPKCYFTENPGALDRYLVPGDLLDYDDFDKFLTQRRSRIWERVRSMLAIPEEQLPEDIR